MNKITTWLFHLSWVRELKKLDGLKYKFKIEYEAIVSRCILEILNDVQVYWEALRQIPYKLDVKAIENYCARWVRDGHGQPKALPDPVFSTNVVARIVLRFWYFVLLIVLFPLAESFLFYLTASLFVPGGSDIMKGMVSVFLALLVFFGCGYGLDKHFRYRRALELFEKKIISKEQLTQFRHRLVIGYVILFFSLLTIIFAGLARIFFLEYIPPGNLPPDKAASVQKASDFASLVTFCVTIVTGLLLAGLKEEQGSYNIKYFVYRKWRRANVRRNRLAQSAIHNAGRLLYEVDRRLEKNWQLCIDLKRIFRDEAEHDKQYEGLYRAYQEEKAKPGFEVTDDIYLRFSEISGTYPELFKHAVLRDPAIKEKVAFAKAVAKLPKDAIEAYLRSIAPKPEPDILNLSPNGNGHSNHNHISHSQIEKS